MMYYHIYSRKNTITESQYRNLRSDTKQFYRPVEEESEQSLASTPIEEEDDSPIINSDLGLGSIFSSDVSPSDDNSGTNDFDFGGGDGGGGGAYGDF